MRTMWCGFVVVALGACDAGAPSCKDAVAKAASHGAGEHAAIVKVCEDKKWSGDIRGCLARATSSAKVDDCLRPVITDVLESEAQQALDDAKAAMEKLEALQRELDADDIEVQHAIDEVMNATTDKQRAQAQAALLAERGKKAELEAKIAQARAAAERTERAKGVHISPACLDNPLAKGCS